MRQKILVYGAGVLGSLCAARLQQGGHDVSLLARGQRLADLREHGLVLEDSQSGQRTVTQVNVVEALEPDDAYDLVLVVVQMQQTESVLPALAANKHTPNVLFIQNNPAGPHVLTQALERERVLLGFAGAGGTRDGHVIRYVLPGNAPLTIIFGEIDGEISPRAERIAAAFKQAGIATDLRADMVAWLKYHVAVVGPGGLAIYAAGGDNYRLARTRDGVVLAVRAVVESMRALEKLGYPVSPPVLKALYWLPEPLLVVVLQRIFDSKLGELGMAEHANAAREEMTHMIDAVREFAREAGADMPHFEQLYPYLDPATPPLPEGSQNLPMRWDSVLYALGGLALVLLVLRKLARKCCR
jgi:2-dehydropantoate 2-reductase